MSPPNLWSEHSWYPCGRDPVILNDGVVVFNSVVEESKNVFPIVVSCQDGEAIGVSFGPIHQRLVLMADGYSYCYLWDVEHFVLHFAVVAQREVFVVEHRDVTFFFFFSMVAYNSDV